MLEPADTPVTTPVLLIVATAVLLDTHGVVAAAVPEPVNVVVLLAQTVAVPVIVGSPLTITFTVAVQPLLFV